MAICRIRRGASNSGVSNFLWLSRDFGVGPELQAQYVQSILEHFNGNLDSRENNDVRDWDFVLQEDGSVMNLADATTNSTGHTTTTEAPSKRYAPHHQIPDAMISHLDDEEKTKRVELFAIGTLLYEMATSKKFFDGLQEARVEQVLMEGFFPEDAWNLPLSKSILLCWCPELSRDLSRPLLSRFTRYVKSNPDMFSLQALGGAVSIGALTAVPLLGVVGFTAAGPAAGSAAAAWQASIGAVQAGSLFAWCQSAAMGGAAVGGIVATAVSGATVTAGATAQQVLGSGNDNISPTELKEMFLKAWARQAGDS